MSAVIKQEQQEIEARIHQFAPDPGVQAIRDWLIAAQDVLNAKWHKMEGDQLTRAQGYAGNLIDLLRIINDGPKIPRQELKPNGGTQ